MPQKRRLLTKTAYGYGLLCDKLFWMYQNKRDELPEPGETTQAIFDQGHLIGNLAKSIYPDGVEIDWSSGHDAGIAQTSTALRDRIPIFEAGFQHGQTHARADILRPAARGAWDLIEVKSSGQVKDEHYEDVAYNAQFEVRVLESCVRHFPKFGAWLESIRPRVVDLHAPFRDFHYYHPGQSGSTSLKAVMPALTGRDYEKLEIADGQTASLRFREMAFGNLAEAGKKAIRKALEIYCRQDAEGMSGIMKALRRLCD